MGARRRWNVSWNDFGGLPWLLAVGGPERLLLRRRAMHVHGGATRFAVGQATEHLLMPKRSVLLRRGHEPMSTEATSLLRYDVTTNDWVLFAPARARRPHARVGKTTDTTQVDPCPFCPGNEHLAPDEVLRIEGGEAGWRVRVVPNKYPALDPSAPPEQRELGPVFREMGGYGVHEVVVESPEHSRSLSRQPLDQVE
jgi:hypothetical protein